MRTLPKAQWRLLGFAATSLILIFTLACINRPMKNATPNPFIGGVISRGLSRRCFRGSGRRHLLHCAGFLRGMLGWLCRTGCHRQSADE